MPANVVEGTDDTVGSTHHQDGHVQHGDVLDDIIPWSGKLFLTTDLEPDMFEDRLALAVKVRSRDTGFYRY